MRLTARFRAFWCFLLALGFILEPVSACSPHRETGRHRSTYCSSCERDANGRIKRSTSVRTQFQAEHPCPSTGLPTGPCPGYIKDHIRALKHGGTDTIQNMQREKTDEAKKKDRVE